MNKLTALSVAASLAVLFTSLSTVAVAAEPAPAWVRVSGEKVDSGLGDLPHYSKWADPTGKNPGQIATQAKSIDKPAQRQPVELAQFR